MAKPYINPNEIPASMMEAIRDQFERQPEVRRLRVQADQYTRQHNYIAALQANKAIEQLFQRVVANYIQEAEDRHETVSLSQAGIPKADIDDITRRIVTLMMAVDIIDTCIIEINEAIHRTDPLLQFESFDDIQATAKLARDKLRLFQRETSYMDTARWGDTSDEMLRLMLNKAAKLIRNT